MSHFWCILLAFFILSCGDKSTGPEIEPEPIPNHEAGDLIIDLPGGVKMAFIRINPGTFTMGASVSEIPDDDNVRPQHKVTLTRAFFIGKYEVTQAQWKNVMASEFYPEPWLPFYGFGGIDSSAIGDNFPAVLISFWEVKQFLRKLNKIDPTATYWLPTEAEWEYVCRAGTTTPFSFGQSYPSYYMWYSGNSAVEQYLPPRHHEVGLKKPNPWGLYDMHGNVAEFVDYWDKQYMSEAQIDPQATFPPEPTYHKVQGLGGYYTDYPNFIVRGGSYLSGLDECQSAARTFWGGGLSGWLWDIGRKEVGFRVLRRKK